jgi:4-amino-4-deoxy-L-arabinose transferase-like glycosyltransferase
MTLSGRDAYHRHHNGEVASGTTEAISPTPQANRSSDPASVRRSLPLVVPIALFLLLRVPSLIEPQWYQDEAGYASTIWLTHLGYGIYVNAWNDKPPLLFAIYGLSQFLWGPSEAGLHVWSLLSGFAALLAAVWGLSRMYSTRAALWGGLIIAILIGSPMLDGQLALPESLLIGPATVGVIWFLIACAGPSARVPRARTLVLIGVLLACAVLIQQTALAETASVLLWCLVRRRWRDLSIVGGTVVITAAIVVLPFVISSGAHNVWYALVSSYGGYVQGGLHGHLETLAFRIAIILAMAIVAWLFRNTTDGRLELVRIWTTAMLFTAIAPGYNYEHFLLPAVVPVVMLITGIVSRHRRELWASVRQVRILIAVATLGMLSAITLTTFQFPHYVNWSLGYYANAAGYVSGSTSQAEYERYFGLTTLGERQAEHYLSAHGLVGVTAMVWANLAWPLVDEQLIPPTRSGPLYVTLALENGTAQILATMNASPPRVILITPDGIEDLPDIRNFISSHAYTKVLDGNGVELYVRSDG